MHQRTRSMPAQHSCVIKRIQAATKGFFAFSALMTSFGDVRRGASMCFHRSRYVDMMQLFCKTNNRNTGQVTNDEPVALAIAHLPLSLGGLGLTSAALQGQTAHWASWADAIPVLQQQVPTIAAALPQQLESNCTSPPSSHRISNFIDDTWMGTTWLDSPHRFQTTSTTTPGHRHPHQLPSRTRPRPRSIQPCTPRIPIRPARQQSIRNHPKTPPTLPTSTDCCSP